jgi:20S proteasome subunit alpha 7
LYAYYRPFGATSIVGGVDEDGPQLYMIEPSGLYWVRCIFDLRADRKGYYGAAAGKGKQVAKNELEKLDLKNMTCREAVYKAAKMSVLPSLSLGVR